MALFDQFSSLFRLPGARRKQETARLQAERLRGRVGQPTQIPQQPTAVPPTTVPSPVSGLREAERGITGPTLPPTTQLAGSPTGQPTSQIAGIQSSLANLKSQAEAIQRGIGNIQPPPTAQSTIQQTQPAVTTDGLRGAEESILGLISPTSEEQELMRQLINLRGSQGLGIQREEERPIPLDLLRGRQEALFKQSQIGIGTLQDQLALTQSRRQASLDVAKEERRFEESRLEREFAERGLQRESEEARLAREFRQGGRELEERRFELEERRFERAGIEKPTAPKIISRDEGIFLVDPDTRDAEQLFEAPVSEEELAADATARSEALGSLSLVNEILENPNLGRIVGPLRVPFITNRRLRNQIEQLGSLLSLENRQKLKGQGTISDFESRILASAGSALGGDPNKLTEKDFDRELKKIRGVFANAAGLESVVVITDPTTGESQIVRAGREGIEQALAEGLRVEYQ